MGGRPDLPAGTVTLVFTDIEGSTRLLHELGDDYPRLLGEHRQLLRAAFQGHGGVEVDTQGDAFFYVFPDAVGALLAAAQAQREHAAHPWPQGLELRVRMGVHTGEPARTEEGYVGIELHQGARVMAAGHGGQVVLSAPTATLLGAGELGDVFLVDLGEHRLKDLTEPQRLYQLAGPGLRGEFPPLKTLEGHFTNLPAQPSALIGRESELAELAEVLGGGEVRLLTLIGPGGTGKTRLALQAGADALDRFPGGVFFCELAALADPALLASTIAQAIGLEEAANRTLEETVSASIGDKSLLLLLDNFEHLLTGAPLVSRLLGACPSLVVLVTSRAPLRLRGEREYEVRALPPDEAVELFLARALAINNALVLDEAAHQTAAMICARLDGLPLALELAAARVRALPLPKLLERLDQRLGLLTGGARDAPERQRTLRATLDWSHELLVPDDQRVFARLGVFAAGATLASAETVCDATLDGISSLVENSLLRAATHADGEPRYSMLETVREYALERLDERGEQEQLRRQHADFFVALAQDAETGLMGAEQMRWFDRLDQELSNLRAALSFLLDQDAVAAARLASSLWLFWEVRLSSEGRGWLAMSIAGPRIPDPERAAALLRLGHLALFQGDYAQARRALDEAAALYEALKDAEGLVQAVGRASWVADEQGDKTVALTRLAQGLAVLSSIETTWIKADTCLYLGGAAFLSGEPARGQALTEEALVLWSELGNMQQAARARHNLGNFALAAGELEKAAANYEESLRSSRTLRDSYLNSLVLCGLGIVALKQGDLKRARALFRESLAICAERGDRRVGSEALTGLAAVAVADGDLVRGIRLAGAVHAICQEMGVPIAPDDLDILEENVFPLREQIGSAPFDTELAAGKAMSFDNAIAYAIAADLARSAAGRAK